MPEIRLNQRQGGARTQLGNLTLQGVMEEMRQREQASANAAGIKETLAYGKEYARSWKEFARQQKALLREEATTRKQEERERSKIESTALREREKQERENLRQRRERSRLEMQGEIRLANEKRDAERAFVAAQQRRQAKIASALGQGALVGSVIGAASSGSPAAVIRAALGGLGGGLGGAAGFALGGATGAAIGEMAGAILGEIAAAAVNPLGGAFSASKPWISYRQRAAALGRAGGFPGRTMENEFYFGKYANGNYVNAIPQWMQNLNVSSQDALDMIQAYGIVPRTGSGAQVLVKRLAAANMTPEMSGLDVGLGPRVLGQGAGLGTGGAGGWPGFEAFRRLMAESLAAGIDRTKMAAVFINLGEAAAAQGGLTGSQNSTAQLLSAMLATGTPGGRSGGLAAAYSANVGSTLDNPMGNPLAMTFLLSAASRYNNLKTVGDVRRFLGPNVMAGANPTRDNIVAQIAAAGKAGNLPTAIFYATQLLKSGDRPRYGELITPGVKQFSGGQGFQEGLFFSAGGLGHDAGLAQAYGARTGPSTAGMGYTGQIGGRFDKNVGTKGYLDQLKKLGVRDNLAQIFVDVGMKRGINPLMLAGIAAHESSGGSMRNIGRYLGPSKNRDGTIDYGMMGINSSDPGMFKYAHMGTYQNVDAGAMIFRRKLAAAGGDPDRALITYGGHGMANAMYPNAVARSLAGVNAGIPTDVNRVRVQGEAGNLSEAHLSFNALVPAAQGLNGAVEFTSSRIKHLGLELDILSRKFENLSNMISVSHGRININPHGVH